MELNLSVADSIRAELARKRKTQAELGSHLHLSVAAVNRRLAGEVPWSLPELAATARFLGVQLSRLIRDAELAGAAAAH